MIELDLIVKFLTTMGSMLEPNPAEQEKRRQKKAAKIKEQGGGETEEGKNAQGEEPEVDKIDQYFETLQQLSENSLVPTRSRFLIKDLIELRRDNWRGQNVGPKVTFILSLSPLFLLSSSLSFPHLLPLIVSFPFFVAFSPHCSPLVLFFPIYFLILSDH